MILTDSQIRQAVAKGEIKITPFDDSRIQSASLDLRVGEFGATTKTKQKVDIKTKGFLLLEPGDFGVIEILEAIEFNNQHVGRIGLRSKYARKGVIATTGPQIDPGFRGRLVLGLTNLTPRAVSVPYDDEILTLEIHKLSEPCATPYEGPYQGRMSLGPEELEAIAESEGMALSEVLTTLKTLTSNVGDLSSQMRTLQWLMPTILGIGLTVISVLVGMVAVFR